MTVAPAKTAGRIRRLHSVIEGPADIWLLCRMALWAAALPLLKHALRLDTLARLMWTETKKESRGEVRKILAASGLVTRPLARSGGACYERSLLAYRFLASRGADPKLVVAVRRDKTGVTAHAWVTVDGTTVGEPTPVDDFVPVVVYGRDGQRED